MGKTVVIGGSGFLGSYVVDELIDRGHEVINVDLVPSKYESDAQFVKADILDLNALQSVIDKSVDIVYHFAGLADLNTAIDSPMQAAELNILGTINVLEACRKASIKRFIYASSAYACSNQGSFYGVSKLSAEKFIEEYQHRYGLNYTILRYGSLYAPRVDENNGIYKLLKQAFAENKVSYGGTGEEVREYIHCKDAASLSADILDSNYQNKTMILTGVEKIKYKNLLVMLKEIMNNELEIEFTDQESQGHYFVTPYSFSPAIAHKMTKFEYIDLGQGLIECMTHLHKNLKKES